MAQAELDILLNKLSGRLTGDSKFYTTHRHGKTVVSNYPLHRDPKEVTVQQQAQSDAFGKAVKLCKAEMNNPERLTFWQEQYNQYVKLANKSLSRANAQFFGIDPNTTQCAVLRHRPEHHAAIQTEVLFHPPWLHHRPTNKAVKRGINVQHVSRNSY